MPAVLSPLVFDASRWEGLLADAARRHHVPGIVAGVLRLDSGSGVEQRFTVATGTTNLVSGAPATPDTMCQIGSITKVVTAVMIMQLREEGKLALETPVAEILPEFALGSEHAPAVTVGQLLTHTSGIDGDVFTDTGRGDDCIAEYVAALSETASLFAPGTGWSYCNAGFVLAGRIIEMLDQRSWDESLQERVARRLDLHQFVTLPEQVMLHRHQVGHVREPGQRQWHRAPVAMLPRSMGPAGGITSSVDDLLDFGRAFLRDGQGAAGEALLSAESVRLMAETQVTLDPAASGAAPEWGLGWMLDNWDGRRVLSHGGATVGNNAWFYVLPDEGLVFVVFCNGGVAQPAAEAIYTAFAQEFAGVSPASAPSPARSADEQLVDDELLGEYSDASTSLRLERDDEGELRVTLERKNLDGSGSETEAVELLPANGERLQFVTRSDDLSPWTPVSFTEVDGTACVYVGIRCLIRQ